MIDLDSIENELKDLDLQRLLALKDLVINTIAAKQDETEADILSRYEALLNEAYQSGVSLVKRRGHKKYRNPRNQDEIWAGRGKMPKWMALAVQEGRKIEDMEIEPNQ